MCGKDDRLVLFFGDFFQDGKDFVLITDIQCRGRLIQKNDRGVLRNG